MCGFLLLHNVHPFAPVDILLQDPQVIGTLALPAQHHQAQHQATMPWSHNKVFLVLVMGQKASMVTTGS